MNELILPDWPVPRNVRSVITTRRGGVSKAPYDSLNLGDHVGDEETRVEQNRALLREFAALPADPHWLRQIHGCGVAQCGPDAVPVEADASTTTVAGRVCAVLTADCLPLLICNRSGSRVAAVHAGWRGLNDGVVEATLARFDNHDDELLVWLGPAIGPKAFEVGSEVRDAFLSTDLKAEAGFRPGRPGHWLADLYFLARRRLSNPQVVYIGGGDYCTLSDSQRFFSYRRDGITGRMASLIWLTE